MAIFQFTVVLIPSKWVSNIENDFASLYTEEGYDVSEAWKQFQPTEEVAPLLSRILPEGKGWSRNQKVWGNEESSDIQVWYENGIIESISIRLDLRNEISSLLAKVVNLANELNCDLFIPGGEIIIKPNIFELNKAASESNAAKFLKYPEGFLDGIGSE